jgi:hypothetical protein
LLKKGDKPYWKQRAFGQAHAFEPDVVIINWEPTIQNLRTGSTRTNTWPITSI